MTWWGKWQEAIDHLLTNAFWAIVAGLIVALFSTKFVIRLFIGSILFGAALGAFASYMGWGDGWIIALSILGVMTAPATIAMVTKLNLFDALTKIRDAIDNVLGSQPPK